MAMSMVIKHYTYLGLIYVVLFMGLWDFNGKALKYSALPLGIWAIGLLFVREKEESKPIGRSLGIWFYVAITILVGSYILFISS